MTIVINHSWQGQRTTGQQRYAREISRRMIDEPDVTIRPRSVPGGRIGAWVAAQGLSAPHGGDERLLTLTSRGPLWHPMHVVTVHDHFVLTHPEWYSRRYVATHAPVLRAQLKGAKGLVFVSEATRDRHHELFGERTPHVVAPNGVQPPPLANRAGSASEPHHPFLLAVASQDPRKNTATLVHAYASLPVSVRAKCALVLVGGADMTVFRGGTAAHEDISGIVRLDYVSEADLWSLYRRAVALVMPSLDEGFGLPLIEAASVGTPLVISDIPVFRWIAGESALYFNPWDLDSVSEALLAATRDPQLPPSEGVADRFDWHKSAADILRFVRDLRRTGI